MTKITKCAGPIEEVFQNNGESLALSPCLAGRGKGLVIDGDPFQKIR